MLEKQTFDTFMQAKQAADNFFNAIPGFIKGGSLFAPEKDGTLIFISDDDIMSQQVFECSLKNAVELAVAFSDVLKEWLKPDEMKEVIRLNTTDDDYREECASHNYCDANMAMAEAFKKLIGREFDIYLTQAADPYMGNDIALFNIAWQIARDNKFYFS